MSLYLLKQVYEQIRGEALAVWVARPTIASARHRSANGCCRDRCTQFSEQPLRRTQ